MTAKIYRPAKNAMQSGTGNSQHWVLEYTPAAGKTIDPVMGWTGSSDMNGQLRMSFDTLEGAKGYADRHKIQYVIKPDQRKKKHIQSYADNFK